MVLSAVGWRAATLAWLDELVVGKSLCPWASPAIAADGFRLLAVTDVALLESAIVEEARILEASTTVRPTTLIVVDADVEPPAAFGQIATLAQARLASTDIDLLAFHPSRLDTGPGCVADPEDAAHFSVRSPLPTLQLLKRSDLASTRDEWKAVHNSPLPGALGLLHENKRKLRRIGSTALRSSLEKWREHWNKATL